MNRPSKHVLDALRTTVRAVSDQSRAADAAAITTRTERDRVIREALANGMTQQDAAEAAQLSQSMVQKLAKA